MYWAGGADYLRGDEEAAKVYLPNDRPPKVGEIFRNTDLAWSLQQIAEHGRDAYYKGEIGKRMLEAIKRHSGVMTAQDLAEFSAEWVEPISTTYRDWTVYEMPPNGQGLAALLMLNIMETFPLGAKDYGFGSTKSLHAMIEAKKLAYADLVKYIGDPRAQRLPVETLLSKEHTAERAKLIDPDHANCEVATGTLPGAGDTTYLTVVDRDGNMVSLIQSNYSAFGSGIVAPGTGFVLQNRGGLFNLDPTSPNALAGRKRPLHTIIPAFAQKGDTRIAFGIMGGWNQSQAHAQFVADVADYKMNIQAALEAPRFTKSSFEGCDVQMESRISGKNARRVDREGAQDSGDGDVFVSGGRRSGGAARFRYRSELWSVRPAQGWSGGRGNAVSRPQRSPAEHQGFAAGLFAMKGRGSIVRVTRNVLTAGVFFSNGRM